LAATLAAETRILEERLKKRKIMIAFSSGFPKSKKRDSKRWQE
jgi:hypothetical protein